MSAGRTGPVTSLDPRGRRGGELRMRYSRWRSGAGLGARAAWTRCAQRADIGGTALPGPVEAAGARAGQGSVGTRLERRAGLGTRPHETTIGRLFHVGHTVQGERHGSTGSEYRDLILATHHRLKAPLTWVWDNLNVHKAHEKKAGFIDGCLPQTGLPLMTTPSAPHRSIPPTPQHSIPPTSQHVVRTARSCQPLPYPLTLAPQSFQPRKACRRNPGRLTSHSPTAARRPVRGTPPHHPHGVLLRAIPLTGRRERLIKC